MITDLSDACNVTKEHETYVEKINGMINFMCEKGMKPGCKTLTRETTYSDFIYAGNNTETMNSARDIANSKMKGDELMKQWKNKHNNKIRAKNKSKQREIWKNSGENTSHHTESQRTQRQAQPFPWVIIPWEHQHTQRNCESPSTNPMYQKLPQY